MKNITKRSVSIVLSLILCFSVVFGFNFSAEAATVDYVKDGSYIYNWGVREEVATFLSPNAEAFYTKNNTSYAKLSVLAGSVTESAVPSSALYKELQTLMTKNHSYINSYDKIKSVCKYTDCQNSAKTNNKISSFYSGNDIGPSWNGEWNREHTWPNSKGDKAGSGENDIMMIRPTASSENGSRGNKAYGKSSGYYNPNNESGGKHDLRGDVARIVLYQYVRWNCTNTGSKYNSTGIYGTNGVIESRAVLLEWMEADPVDTWELGRNDSVQSITGTRNVFVDYPELAFIMLGTDVPTDYATPSGEAKKGATTPAPNPGNNNSSNTQTGNTSSTTSNNNNNTSSNTSSKPNTNTSSNTSSKPSSNTSSNTTSSTTSSNTTTSTPVDTNCKHKNIQIVAAEDARCDAEGFTEGEYCLDCKTYISGREVIEPQEHSYGDDDVCTYCGDKKETVTDDETTEDTTTIGAIENNDDLTTTDDESSGIGTVGWIIIIVAAAAVAGGTVFVIMYYTKKQAKK